MQKQMSEKVLNRVVNAADLILKGNTIRQAAHKLGFSKSTVFVDMKERLKFIDEFTYTEVMKELQKNKSERHIRGGEATKRKFFSRHFGFDLATGSDISAEFPVKPEFTPIETSISQPTAYQEKDILQAVGE